MPLLLSCCNAAFYFAGWQVAKIGTDKYPKGSGDWLLLVNSVNLDLDASI